MLPRFRLLTSAAALDRQNAVVNGEVDLDEMDHIDDKKAFLFRCRCSGSYTITEAELEEGIDVACCDNCSLRIRVLYEVVEEEIER